MQLGSMSNVLVLLAPYGSEKPSTSQFVAQLQASGACILKTQAKAEVSLTRCVLAANACDALRQLPDLQWVFWLDQDVSGTVGNILHMIEVASHVMMSAEGQGYPTLSGVYVNRYSEPPRLACYALKDFDPIVISELAEQPIMLVASLCGMGCLLQHRSVFLAHCDEAPHFRFPSRETIVPEVCTSHRIHTSELAKYLPVNADEDCYYWQSEDFDYCAREFEHGRLVFTVPVGFGHECDRVIFPEANSIYPGLRPHVAAG